MSKLVKDPEWEWDERRIRDSVMNGERDSRDYWRVYKPDIISTAERINRENGEQLLDRAKILKDFVKKFIKDKEAEENITFDLGYFFYEDGSYNQFTASWQYLKSVYDKCDEYCDLTMHLLVVFPRFNGILSNRHKLFIIGALKYYNWDKNRGLTSNHNDFLRKSKILNKWYKNISQEAFKSRMNAVSLVDSKKGVKRSKRSKRSKRYRRV
jgi:hypothetical protein